MVALTRDFDVFTSPVSASFPAVFFSARDIAKTRYVRALFRLLIRHDHHVLSIQNHLLRLLKQLATLDVAPFPAPTEGFEGILYAVWFRQLRHFQ
jgi:hypothetical protein